MILANTNANGFVAVPLSVPRDLRLLGQALHVQAGTLDPLQSGGFALSRRATLQFGRRQGRAGAGCSWATFTTGGSPRSCIMNAGDPVAVAAPTRAR